MTRLFSLKISKTAIERVERCVQGQTYTDFVNDEKGLYAVFMNLSIIGEAANSIPDSIKSIALSVPWKKIIGMRNKLVHEYWGYDTKTVWETIGESLPELKREVEQLMKKLEP